MLADLSRMYKLYGRITEGLDEMRKITLAFIVQSGQKINDDPSSYPFCYQRNHNKNLQKINRFDSCQQRRYRLGAAGD